MRKRQWQWHTTSFRLQKRMYSEICEMNSANSESRVSTSFGSMLHASPSQDVRSTICYRGQRSMLRMRCEHASGAHVGGCGGGAFGGRETSRQRGGRRLRCGRRCLLRFARLHALHLTSNTNTVTQLCNCKATGTETENRVLSTTRESSFSAGSGCALEGSKGSTGSSNECAERCSSSRTYAANVSSPSVCMSSSEKSLKKRSTLAESRLSPASRKRSRTIRLSFASASCREAIAVSSVLPVTERQMITTRVKGSA